MLKIFKYIECNENYINFDKYLEYVAGINWGHDRGLSDLLSFDRLDPHSEKSLRESYVNNLEVIKDNDEIEVQVTLAPAFKNQGLYVLNYYDVEECTLPEKNVWARLSSQIS